LADARYARQLADILKETEEDDPALADLEDALLTVQSLCKELSEARRRCNAAQHVAMQRNTLQRSAARCNAVQHVATQRSICAAHRPVAVPCKERNEAWAVPSALGGRGSGASVFVATASPPRRQAQREAEKSLRTREVLSMLSSDEKKVEKVRAGCRRLRARACACAWVCMVSCTSAGLRVTHDTRTRAAAHRR
jgi:hypothetical protein